MNDKPQYAPDQLPPSQKEGLRKEMAACLNRYSAENGCDTPDFILADYLLKCLEAFDSATLRRSQWYGYHSEIGNP